MKEIERIKCRTVQASTAEEFDREFGKVSAELPSTAELKWEPTPFTVHFIYKETDRIAETVQDEFELNGIKYECKDCPYLEKDDDKRKKRHKCRYAAYGLAYEDGPACEVFYKRLLNGLIKPEGESK